MANQDALGLLLVQEGVITATALHQALALQRQTHGALATCLLRLGLVGEETLLHAQGRLLELPIVPLTTLLDASPAALARVPAAVAMRLHLVPVTWDGTVLGVALSEGETLTRLDEVAVVAQAAVGAYAALPGSIDAALVQLYEPEPLGLTPIPVPVPPTAGSSVPTLPTVRALSRRTYAEASQGLSIARSTADVACALASVLLNYVPRVLAFACRGMQLRLVGWAPTLPRRQVIPLAAVLGPDGGAALGRARPVYAGPVSDDAHALMLADCLGAALESCIVLLAGATAERHDVWIYGDGGGAIDAHDAITLEQLVAAAEGALKALPDA